MIRKLNVASIITLILGVSSVIAVLLTYLALCDIGTNQEPNLTMEWDMVGIGLSIWIIFIVSTMVTLIYVFRLLGKNPISA